MRIKKYTYTVSINRAKRDADGRVMRDESGMTVSETLTRKVEAEIDLDEILKAIGESAARNRTGRAKAYVGIKAKVLK